MSQSAPKVLPTRRLNLKDRLSRLTYAEACKILGHGGRKLMQRHINQWDIKIQDDVYLGADLFRMRFPSEPGSNGPAVVSITLKADARNRLHCHCTSCRKVCPHLGFALAIILEEKLVLGLAAKPIPREPVESLADDELLRFCDRDVQLINGPAALRHQQYGNDCFFTVCNYEQVLRDILAIERTNWDMIILDEGQRIKNWESKTSRVIKALRSRFALVLTGTPLENRLDDLYSIVQFVDDRRLGPGFRFFNKHRVVDEKGRVLGYKNLGELRERLAPVLLRRTRESVRLQLPDRTMELVRIPPTDEQFRLHHAHMQIVMSIANKKFLSEMDLLKLRIELLMCRMAANSTFLVDKKAPGYSTKLERLDELFESLFDEEGRKVVLFSEWTTMLNLIEPLLDVRELPYVRLDGSVPQRQRQELVHRFQTDPDCRLFLTTNAGSTGLNLQAANTVINVDLPWNPAVLEQRIARAHRMGQQQPVQVFALITEQTIEESLLKTLAAKKDLALAALDMESEVDAVDVASGMQELKNRLEVLLGAHPEAPLDLTVQVETRETADQLSGAHRDRVAAAGGELLGAAFKLLGELVSHNATPAPPENLVASVRDGLGSCIEEDPAGKPRLVLTLPDRNALNQLAETLAKLLAAGQAGGDGKA